MGALWASGDALRFARLGRDGEPLTETVRIGDFDDGGRDGFGATVAAGDAGLAVAWRSPEGRRLQLVDLAGTPRGAPLPFGGGPHAFLSADLPAVAWSGDRYGVAFVAGPDDNYAVNELRFLAVSADGRIVVPETRITAGAQRHHAPSIAATRDGFAVAWSDDRHGEDRLRVLEIDRDGRPLGPDTLVSDALGTVLPPRVAASGAGLVIGAPDGRAPPGWGVAWRPERCYR
jgi:hypothetical protein